MESWRAAQIVTDRAAGSASFRGSGYLVAPGLVLTAAHVLAWASVVRVRLDVGQPGEVDVQAEQWWADPDGRHGTDLAVVMIPADVTAGRKVDLARFGRMSDCTAVLAVRALGFPRFKLRGGTTGAGEREVFRDLDQVTGHAPVAANRRQGTLAVYLDDPPPAAPERAGTSPWEGMSGAAVWTGGRVVGVVAEHHASEGTGRLTVRRIDRVYEHLPESDLDRLVTWLGLAQAAGQLPDVVPAEPGQFLQSAYLEQVRDLAPDALIGRDAELAEWAEFCAGAETYAWWQAGPWAGKSALASWFVIHPPAGVDIVSFFITSRLAGQADSDAFLDAMIEQLNALGPASGRSPPVAGARVGMWLSLLAGAASRAEERERRLVVVVDGLDEDEAGAGPLRGRPSIASLLPRRPPPGARFVITSRPGPGLPDDVPSGHPLRACMPRGLPVSWVAEDMERRAKQELRDLFAGDQIAVDVVGYVAGSGGGLTRSDLSALTGAPPHKLDPVLRGVFGRSLQTRISAYSCDGGADPAPRVYLFAHETLRVTAEEQLGGELARYRQRVHDWIGSYASGGWPDITPGYGVRGYLRLLTATGDVMRLAALALDPDRLAFLLRATGSDYAALTEIRDAQKLISVQNVPDLQAVVELAVYRHTLSIRNQFIPIGLPAVWARLGRFEHAEALARTITHPGAQTQALTQLAAAIAQAGDPDRAEALARAITDPYLQAEALAQLAAAAAQAVDPDRASRLAADAEALARAIADPFLQAEALAQLAAATAEAADPDRASRLSAEILDHAISHPYAQDQALAELATAIGRAGDPDRAEALARAIANPGAQDQALTQLATAIAQAGDPDRAEALARAITSAYAQAEALAQLGVAAAQAADPDRASRLAADAETLARTITDPYAPLMLAQLAAAAAQAADPDRASRLAADAESLARTIADPFTWPLVLAQLATVAVKVGDLDRAEALARAITDPDDQAQALTQLATEAAQAGNPDRAQALVRTIASPYRQAQVLAQLATVAAQAGDPERAEALARAITSPNARAQALTELATAAAQAADPDRASRLAADAEALARTITDPDTRARTLAQLAAAAAGAADLDLAEALARAITGPDARAEALAQLATAAAQAGDSDRASRLAAGAEALARTITDPDTRARTLAQLATAAAQAADPDRASRLSAEVLDRAISHPYLHDRALAELATAIGQAGDLNRAEALARAITDPDDQAPALAQLATAAAQAADPDRASRLAADAETLARAITDHYLQARALAQLATAAAQAADPDRASRLAADAEALARTIIIPPDRARAFALLAAAAAQAADPDRAEALARTITDPDIQARALTELAKSAAQIADLDRASRLAADIEALARTITNTKKRGQALAELAIAIAQAGDLNRADALARTITDPDGQAQALAELAAVAAQAGDPNHARRLIALAITAEVQEIGGLAGTVSRLFPSVIRDAGDVFLGAYKAEM